MNSRAIGRAETPEAVYAMIEDGFNRCDVDAVVAAYEDDAMLVVSPGGHLALGRNGIHAATAQALALRPEMTLMVSKLVESNGTAITQGRWRVAITSPDGARRRMAGRGTLVLRRRAGGTWGIVLDDLGLPRPFRAVSASSTVGRKAVGPVRRVS